MWHRLWINTRPCWQCVPLAESSTITCVKEVQGHSPTASDGYLLISLHIMFLDAASRLACDALVLIVLVAPFVWRTTADDAMERHGNPNPVGGAAMAWDCVLDTGTNMSALPSITFPLAQWYQNQLHDHVWTISLCNPVAPQGGTNCVQNGNSFIVENRVSNGACETSWNTLSSVSSSSGSSSLTAVLQFAQSTASSNPSWTATVSLQCGGGESLLGPVPGSRVVVTGPSVNALNFAFQLQTSLLCLPEPSGSPMQCDAACWFLVAVLGGFYVYVFGTMLFNVVYRQQRGLANILPHPVFWREFASLVRDGLVFVCCDLLCCCRTRRTGSRRSAASEPLASTPMAPSPTYRTI